MTFAAKILTPKELDATSLQGPTVVRAVTSKGDWKTRPGMARRGLSATRTLRAASRERGTPTRRTSTLRGALQTAVSPRSTGSQSARGSQVGADAPLGARGPLQTDASPRSTGPGQSSPSLAPREGRAGSTPSPRRGTCSWPTSTGTGGRTSLSTLPGTRWAPARCGAIR